MIFIDFDDVLFNTKRFKEDLQNLFFQHGISREVFEKYYHNPDQKKILKTYDPWNHLEMIRKGEGIDTEKAKKELEEFMVDTTAYLFGDSRNFLKSFSGEFVCIVSYGESQFQEMKIGECGIGTYCEKVQITDELKSMVIEKILKDKNPQDENVFFIEDRIEQIEDVKKKFPFVKTIFMRRSEGRYHDALTQFCDFEAASLKEAEGIINSLK
ncbi:MAG TPA: hypothetical protein DCX32_04245 [Candidatus Moranbacteria bacterium]|nr:MAG: hypothetical protein UW87_C0027G0005 [Candidatus Moranbacteria bacterium GW2011_GWC2_45_10]KKT94863.1 MAG: hypothetical protein UW95_C0007G0005 [Parcubacteria group bacterium GW2011_GWC1_45_14]HAV11718.1 hypothetical protein [Candidatus Moranbacteria bacterium]